MNTVKYNAVAFSGKNQVAHLSSLIYSEEIERFIIENETLGFKVLVDLLIKIKPIQQVYITKNK